jgi:hypothetical protein
MRNDLRITLLRAQTLLLGLTAGFLVVPASGLFLHSYGSKNLAWVYVAIGIFGIVSTFGLLEALRRWSIATVGTLVFLSVATTVLGSWLQLVILRNNWVSAPLLVLFPLTFQIGFVLIGGQAGRVFNLDEMKSSFGKVVAGFPLGFVIAGLVATLTIGPLHGSQHLLLLSVIASFILVLLFRRTSSAFPSIETSQPVPVTSNQNHRSLRQPIRNILGNPFVRTLLAYQTVVFAQSQIVEFLLFDRAANRYRSADQLSTFVSTFQAVMNATTMAFVLLVAGFAFRRFGMRYGAFINPGVAGRHALRRGKFRLQFVAGVLSCWRRTYFKHFVNEWRYPGHVEYRPTGAAKQ